MMFCDFIPLKQAGVSLKTPGTGAFMRAAVSLGLVLTCSLILSREFLQCPSAPGSKTLRLSTTEASVKCVV